MLVPLCLSVALIAARKAKRRYDSSSWAPVVEKSIAAACDKLSEAIQVASSKYLGSGDPYSRTDEGPDGAQVWADRVAASVVTTAVEETKQRLAARLGFTQKTWVTRGDDRVRDTHGELDGVQLDKDTPFQTSSGAVLDRPGDQTAPMSEWVNCRCRLAWSR